MASVAVAVGVLLVSACSGSDASPETEEASDAPAEESFTVVGEIHVDEVGSVELKRDPDRCVGRGDLAELLADGAQSVVIAAPDGREVALGTVVAGTAPTVQVDGEERYVPGSCDLPFLAEEVPWGEGVFTASIPGLGVEGRFTVEEADSVQLTYDPS